MTGKPNPRFVITNRREKVLMLLAQGLSECEISNKLGVGQSTISRDTKALNRESMEMIKTIEKDYYPLEFRNITNSITQVLKKSWQIINDNTDKWTNKDKINAMKLVIEASRTKFDILRNGSVNLAVNEMRVKVEKLLEVEEASKSYFKPPALETIDQDELR